MLSEPCPAAHVRVPPQLHRVRNKVKTVSRGPSYFCDLKSSTPMTHWTNHTETRKVSSHGSTFTSASSTSSVHLALVHGLPRRDTLASLFQVLRGKKKLSVKALRQTSIIFRFRTSSNANNTNNIADIMKIVAKLLIGACRNYFCPRSGPNCG